MPGAPAANWQTLQNGKFPIVIQVLQKFWSASVKNSLLAARRGEVTLYKFQQRFVLI
jgi:hypothetical protein